MKKCLTASLLATALIGTAVEAAPIIQDQSTGAGTIFFQGGNAGQSFTAEDANVTIDFYIWDVNSHLFPDDHDLTFSLYEGFGNTGSLLGTKIITDLQDGFDDWISLDFSYEDLDIGNTYSILVQNETNRWAIRFASDLYAGGERIIGGDGAVSDSDIMFRVLPVASGDVPAPAPAALLGLGLAALGLSRKKKTV